MESRLPLNQRLGGRVKRPKEIAAWSEDPTGRGIHFDDRALRYYYFPVTELDKEPRINLAKGFDATKFDPDAKRAVYIDNVLKAIIHYEQQNNERLDVNFVTWRGLLTQLINLSQSNADQGALRDSFEYLIAGFDGQIFMSQDDAQLAAAKPQEWKTNPSSLRYMYTGFQFEQVATLPKPWGECSRDEIDARYTTGYPVDSSESYGILVKSGIGSVDLVYGAETDCVENYKSSTNKLANYVELKTTQAIQNVHQARGFERKLLRTWIQSFLSGVPKIVYGYRNSDLELETVEEFKTDDLPKIIKNSTLTPPNRKWNGNDAIGFYTILMQWLKDKVEDGKTYKLVYQANTQELTLKPTEISIDGRSVAFLSDEFVNWRRKSS